MYLNQIAGTQYLANLQILPKTKVRKVSHQFLLDTLIKVDRIDYSKLKQKNQSLPNPWN